MGKRIIDFGEKKTIKKKNFTAMTIEKYLI